MGARCLLGYALHLSIVWSLVLSPPQGLPELTTSPPTALDASSKSTIQIVPIPSERLPNSISNLTSPLSYANSTTPTDNATLTEMSITCNGDPFPTPGPASQASCLDAWAYIPSGDDIETFGDRSSGEWDDPLPYRAMSDDGLCVIDFDVMEPGQMDHSSHSALKTAAHALVGVCVRNLNRGGEATGLGQNGRLTATVKKYLPRVQCIPTQKPPVMAMCPYIFTDMPASKAQKLFGRRGTPGIDVALSWAMATPDRQCVIKVGISPGPPVRTSWYQIWQQAVALGVLCGESGKNGEAFIYAGREPRIKIIILNESAQALTLGAPGDIS